MSKQSYGSVEANQASKPGESSVAQGDAPPPYSGPSIPHQTSLPPQQPVPGIHPESGALIQSDGWTPPPSMAVAKSRAVRRFWVAFLWAWAIYMLVGILIGGGISDVENNPPNRSGHWDKHGDWRPDARAPISKPGWHRKTDAGGDDQWPGPSPTFDWVGARETGMVDLADLAGRR